MEKLRKWFWVVPLIASGVVITVLVTGFTGGVTAQDGDDMRMDVNVHPGDPGEIVLSWTAPMKPTGVTGYRIDRAEFNEKFAGAWVEVATNHNRLTYRDQGLRPDKQYAYRVFAISPAGIGPPDYGSGFSGAADCRVAVRSLNARALNQNTISLSWSAPDSNGGLPLTGYLVQYTTDGAQSPDEEMSVDDGTTTHTHAGLEAGTRYRYRVDATYYKCPSGEVAETAHTVEASTPPLAHPGAPRDLAVVPSVGRSFTLYWNAPNSNDWGGLSSEELTYLVEVFYNSDTQPSNAVIDYTPGRDSEFTVPATNGNSVPIAQVRFQVHAQNADGSLKSSSPAQTPTMQIQEDAWHGQNIPGSVNGFTAARDRHGDVTLSWTAPTLTSGTISGYRIDVSDDGKHWTGLTNSVASGATEYKHNDPGMKDRHYRIFARKDRHIGPSASVQSGRGNAAPGPVGNLNAQAAGPSLINLHWGPPPLPGHAPVTKYLIQVSDETKAVVQAPKTTYAYAEGLKANQTLKYCVIAVSAVDNGEALCTRATTSAASRSPAPTGLVVAVVKDPRVDLFWNAPIPPAGVDLGDYTYRVERKKGGTDWTHILDTLDSGTETRDPEPLVDDATQRVLRCYRVATIYKDQAFVGYSNEACAPHDSTQAAVPSVAEPPGAPGTPEVSPDNGQLRVSWAAPSSDGSSAITGYDVQYQSGSTTSWDDGASDTYDRRVTASPAVLPNLDNGTSYRVRVRAVNAIGAGSWSAVVTGTPATVSGSPAGLTITPEDRQLVVSWTAPSITGSSAITDYVVQYRVGASGPWDVWTHTGTATTTTITGLTNGQSYQVQVRAVNAQGSSDWSTASGTPSTVPDAPGAPTVAPGNSQLVVTWTAPANGGSVITDYDVQYRAGTSGSWNPWTHAGTDVTATITGLTNGQSYQVQVRATNARGSGDWSTAAAATPLAVGPVGPAVSTAVPGQPSAPIVKAGDSQLTVSWTAPANGGSVITDYDVQYRAGASGSWNPWTHAGTAVTATITGLTNGQSYQVQVRATNARGSGDWSTATTATPLAVVAVGPTVSTAVPGQPSALIVEAGDRRLTVRWTAPANGGSVITDYDVQYRAGTSGSWNPWTHTGTAVTATITGLTNGQSYQVQVRATNSVGTGSWSTAVSGTPATTPGQPGPLTDTPGDREVTVQWNAPNDGGSPITDYDVQYRTGTAGPWTPWTHTGTATTATITGLTNGQSYQVQVRATNARGSGHWSTAATTTPVSPTAAHITGPPAITSSPASGDTYWLGERVNVKLTFNKGVDVRGAPRLLIWVGNEQRQAAYHGKEGAAGLVFSYRVQADDHDIDGISVDPYALQLNGATIVDDKSVSASVGYDRGLVADPAHKVDGRMSATPTPTASPTPDPAVTPTLEPTVRPAAHITGPPAITSRPVSGDTYHSGERINVKLTFNEGVDVRGSPRLLIWVGNEQRQAAYHGKEGAAGLLFSYRIQAGDRDIDGVSVAPNALELNGATIVGDSGVAASVGYDRGLVADPAHKVDGSMSATPTPTPTPVSGTTPCRGTITGPNTVPLGGTTTLEWSPTMGTPANYAWSVGGSGIVIVGGNNSQNAQFRGEASGAQAVAEIEVTCESRTVVSDTYTLTVMATPVNTPTPTPTPTTVPGVTPRPASTPTPTLRVPAPSAGECTGLVVTASRPEPGARSDLTLAVEPSGCRLPINAHRTDEVSVSLPEHIDVPTSFSNNSVLVRAGNRYQPAWLDRRDEQDGTTLISLLSCRSWRVPGSGDTDVCGESRDVTSVELDSLTLPDRAGTDDDPHRIELRWSSGAVLTGTLKMRATLRVSDDHADWTDRITITATGFEPDLTVRLYARASATRVECETAQFGNSEWDEIESRQADSNGRVNLDLRVDRTFRRVGVHQLCARDGSGHTSGQSEPLEVRPVLELPGSASRVYSPGEEIVLRIQPAADAPTVRTVRVDGDVTRDWRQRRSDLEITIPSRSGDRVPVRVEFEDGTVAQVYISMAGQELVVTSLEGMSRPALLGGRMLVRATGLGGNQVCEVWFEGIEIAFLDGEHRDSDGCVSVDREGRLEAVVGLVTEDGNVTDSLVRALASAGTKGEVEVEDNNNNRASAMVEIAQPSVTVNESSSGGGQTAVVKGMNFPPLRGYYRQPDVKIEYDGRSRYVDHLSTEWTYDLDLSFNRSGSGPVDISVSIDGYRLLGSSIAQQAALGVPELTVINHSVAIGGVITFRASGLDPFTGGYWLKVQNGLVLELTGGRYFNTGRDGSYEGTTTLPAEYHQFLLEDGISRVMVQLYQGDKLIPTALGSFQITTQVAVTATPVPTLTPTPPPTVVVVPLPTLATGSVPTLGPTPELTEVPDATEVPSVTPIVITVPTLVPTPGTDEMMTAEPPATVVPVPVATPTAVPAPVEQPTVAQPMEYPTDVPRPPGATHVAEVPTVEPSPEPIQVSPEPTVLTQQQIAQTVTARVTAKLNGQDPDDPSADEPGEEDQDEIAADNEEDDGGFLGLSSGQLIGVALALVVLGGGAFIWFRMRRSRALPRGNLEPEGDGDQFSAWRSGGDEGP